MVKLRLKRFGTKKRPYYRIVAMDAKAARDGRALQELGFYRPIEAGDQVKVNEEAVKEWLSKGAEPTPTVRQLLNKKGLACGER